MRLAVLAGLLLGLAASAAAATSAPQAIVFTESRCPLSIESRYCDLPQPEQLCAIDAAGGPAQRVLAAATTEVWSPDARHTAFSTPPYPSAPSLVLDMAPLASGSDPVFSPDSSRLAFAQSTSTPVFDTPQIAIAAVDGSSTRRITDAQQGARAPAWSPDGTRLVFQTGSGLGIVGADGSGFRMLAPFGQTPVWSPDGTTIVFARDLYLRAIAPDGSGERQLVAGSQPAFSPDGSQLAFSASGTVAVSAVDGTGAHAVDPVNAGQASPRWLNGAQTAALHYDGTCDRQTAGEGELVEGTAGVDTVFVEHANASVHTYAGDDAIFSVPARSDAPERLDAGDGDDTITIDGGRTTTFAGRGFDRVDARFATAPQRIDAGPGPDTVMGGPRDDVILGGGDRDQLFGETGSNTIYGGAGDDVIAAKGAGPASVQHLYGGPGNDVIKGGHGPDVLSGGAGDDQIYAFDGVRDVVDCGPGTDDLAYVDRHDVVRNCEFILRRPR